MEPNAVIRPGQALAMPARGTSRSLNPATSYRVRSGDTLFKAMARLRAPRELDLDQLRESLEAIASDLMVDISIGEAD